MTTTDTDALTKRIRRARSVPAEWARLREGESTREQLERHQRRMDEQTAALVAEEVRKAKAEAWTETCEAFAWCITNGPVEDALPYVAEHNPYRETGDSDEHR